MENRVMKNKITFKLKNKSWTNYWQKKQGIEKLIEWIKSKWGYKKLLKPFKFPNLHTSLELGAGKAYLSRLLKDRVRFATCMDNNLDIVLENQNYVDAYYLGDILRCHIPRADLILSCGLIEHFKIKQLKQLAKKINSPYILMFYPSCDWKWRLLWKLRRITLTHYQYSNEDLKKVFGNYKTTFGYINFFGMHYNYVYGIK